jgi:LacI family transcriptional regulator
MSPGRRRSSPSVTKIGDVARAAGVSPATVSRVLNGTGAVSAGRAERVHKAATELSYQPFGPARALRQQLTHIWAAIIADIENPFFTTMVRGIEDVALEAGFRVMLCNSDEDRAKEAAYIGVAVAERMAGVIIAVASAPDAALDPLLDRGVPVVAVDRRPLRYEDVVDSVVVDNRLGARLATEHLIAIGAERIACITGPSKASTAAERLAGYRDALRSAGRKAEPRLVRRADFKQDGGEAAATALLRQAQPPDAMFVANNLMTLGALRAVKASGRRVPDDVMLVGFDDAPWTTLISPQLTVVAQPSYEIGRQAGHLLASAEAGQKARHIVLPPTLLIRESSGEG